MREHPLQFAPGVVVRATMETILKSLKYVNLDNFRYLTGHGKLFAEAVDASLMEMEAKSPGVISDFVALAKLQRLPAAATTRLKFGMLSVGLDPANGKFDHEWLNHLDAEMGEGWLLTCFLRSGLGARTATTVPLKLILSPTSWCGHHQLYCHSFVLDKDQKSLMDQPNEYIGVTKRTWQKRWQEHVRSAKNGSYYKFHEAIRNYDSAFTQHTVVGVFETEKDAMDAEERYVAECSLYPMGLNMIPGGYAGMRFLHRIGAVRKGEKVSPDEKHDFINRHFETESRAGRPNPFAAANWLNDEYAEKVICGAPGRMKPSQIREARYLESTGISPDQIAAEVGAKNAAQVRRMLGGDTYSRIH